MDKATRLEILELKRRLNEAEKRISQFYDMKIEKQQSDIDFIAMETDVELEQTEGGDE